MHPIHEEWGSLQKDDSDVLERPEHAGNPPILALIKMQCYRGIRIKDIVVGLWGRYGGEP